MDKVPLPSIMLVEDNEMIRALIADVIEGDYEIETFADAETALARANERRFDLVLMDISLPNMSGMDAITDFRKLPAYANTPIVAMTGHTSPEERNEYLNAGFDDHLGKPFMPDELIDLIARLAPSSS